MKELYSPFFTGTLCYLFIPSPRVATVWELVQDQCALGSSSFEFNDTAWPSFRWLCFLVFVAWLIIFIIFITFFFMICLLCEWIESREYFRLCFDGGSKKVQVDNGVLLFSATLSKSLILLADPQDETHYNDVW